MGNSRSTVGELPGRGIILFPFDLEWPRLSPKTRKGRAPVPVVRQLADRLELHRLRSGNPTVGPIFANSAKKALALGSLVNRVILPALNRCECGKAESNHLKVDHPYKRDASIPEWHGWHAARRGLGSNLYRLGVPDMVIQRILRHANVSTTATYYIKTAAGDVRKAVTKLENHIVDAARAIDSRSDAGSVIHVRDCRAAAARRTGSHQRDCGRSPSGDVLHISIDVNLPH